MKAIQWCEQKGRSLAAPLLDLAEGLTASGEGFLFGDPFLVKLSSVNLESSDVDISDLLCVPKPSVRSGCSLSSGSQGLCWKGA